MINLLNIFSKNQVKDYKKIEYDNKKKRVMFGVKIRPEHKKLVRDISMDKGITISSIIEEAIELYFNKKE